LPYVDNLIYDFIGLAKDPGTIELAGNGQFEREWMHPSDVASAVSAAVTSDRPGCETYIIRGERVTMHELASRIVAQVGEGKITTNPERGGFSIISSSASAEKNLGWKPTVSLDSLIREIWAEYESRHA
jgi:nucleoside-diphosphate-sugar epimerase